VFSSEAKGLYNHPIEGFGDGQPSNSNLERRRPSVFREGLSTIIASQEDMVLAAQATNAVEALAEFRRHRPETLSKCLLMQGLRI
jgi:hypothetical protein